MKILSSLKDFIYIIEMDKAVSNFNAVDSLGFDDKSSQINFTEANHYLPPEERFFADHTNKSEFKDYEQYEEHTV